MGCAACAGPASGAKGSGRLSVVRGYGGSLARGMRGSGRVVGLAGAVPAVPRLLALSPGPRLRPASSLGAGSNPQVEWRRSGVCLLKGSEASVRLVPCSCIYGV